MWGWLGSRNTLWVWEVSESAVTYPASSCYTFPDSRELDSQALGPLAAGLIKQQR